MNAGRKQKQRVSRRSKKSHFIPSSPLHCIHSRIWKKMACRLQMVTFKAPRAENPWYVGAILQNVAVVTKQNMKIHWSNEKVRYFDIWKQQKRGKKIRIQDLWEVIFRQRYSLTTSHHFRLQYIHENLHPLLKIKCKDSSKYSWMNRMHWIHWIVVRMWKVLTRKW